MNGRPANGMFGGPQSGDPRTPETKTCFHLLVG